MVAAEARRSGYLAGPFLHGTAGKFTAFSKGVERATDRDDFGDAHYFTALPSYAQGAADNAARKFGGEPRIIEAFLRLQNPLVLDVTDETNNITGGDSRCFYSPDSCEAILGLAAWSEKEREDLENGLDEFSDEQFGPIEIGITAVRMAEVVRASGHDGIVVHRRIQIFDEEEDYEGCGTLHRQHEVAVFDPGQIKSAAAAEYDDAGALVPLSARFDPTSPDIRSAQPEDTDLAYARAVESKDMAAAQAIVDKQAVADGYNLGPLFHGTPNEFETFDLSYFGRNDDGFYGVAFYFTKSDEHAGEFGANVMRVHVQSNNPLILPDSGTMGDPSLFDARDILAKVLDDPSIATIRTVPDGYEVQPLHRPDGSWGGKRDVFEVVPKPELYGTDREIYGDEGVTPEAAIIAFNDEIRGVKCGGGWLSGLLKDVMDRDTLCARAEAKGYDSIIIRDADSGRDSEILIWDPAQIVRTEAVPTGDREAIAPSMRFAPAPCMAVTALPVEVISAPDSHQARAMDF